MPKPVALIAATAVALAGPIALAGPVTPARAAEPRPTITAPATAAGYQTLTITGTATPGATVQLYESAYVFHDLKPAVAWATTGDLVSTTAAADGSYRIDRWVDTGFLFSVEVGGVRSRIVTVHDRLVPLLAVSSTRAGSVTVRMVATPAQPWVPVQIQRQNPHGSWSVVARGYTADPGTYDVTLGKQPSGRTVAYRAWLGGDPESALLAAYSGVRSVRMR